MAFDTLSYVRRLKQAGVPEAQAEAIADGTREFVVQDSRPKLTLRRLGGRIAIGVAILAAVIKL